MLRTGAVISLALLVWILGTSANLQSIGEATTQDSQDASAVYKRVYNGWKWWHVYCSRCHGEHALGSSLAPNLREPLLPYEEFLRVARDGTPEKGMPAWNQLLDDEQITDIYVYVRARSENVLPPGRPDEVGPNGGGWIPPADWPETQIGAAPEKAQTAATEHRASTTDQDRSADEAAIRTLLAANEASANQRDAAGVAATFAPDGDIWIVGGPRVSGRTEIRRSEEEFYRAPGFREWRVTIDTIRFLSPDVAVVETTTITTLATSETRGQASWVVARRDGAWKIAAVRVMSVEEQP